MCRWGRSELVIDKYCLDKEGNDGRKCWGICQLCQHVLQDIILLIKFKDIGDYQESALLYRSHHFISQKFLFETDLFQKQERVLDRYQLKINLQRLTRRKLGHVSALITSPSLLPVKRGGGCKFYLCPSFCPPLAYTASTSRLPVCNIYHVFLL